MEQWVDWAGGKCPVHGNTRIDVKLRDGRILERVASLPAYMWAQAGKPADIMAYRKS